MTTTPIGNMPIYAIIREVVIILLVTMVLSIIVNFLSPKGIALVGDWDTSRGAVSARAKDDVVHHELEIEDLRTAKTIFDEEDRLFVDARGEAAYQEGHIAGAVSFPLGRFDDAIGYFWESNPMDTEIVTYCSGRLCDDAHHLAQLLKDAGYENVRVFSDGFDEWKRAGYPVE